MFLLLDPKVKPRSGPHYTKMLFREFNPEGPYTLKDLDDGEHLSLYRLYMEYEDLLEHSFANEYLCGWTHWEQLCRAPFFKEYIARWRKELELKVRSKALASIIRTAKTPNKDSFAAQKYIVDKNWKEPAEKGRPKKEDIARAAYEQAAEDARLSEDFERILGEARPSEIN
jgi:hypothetical protein